MSTRRLHVVSLLLVITCTMMAGSALAASLQLYAYPPPGTPTFVSGGGAPGSVGGLNWGFTNWNTSEFIDAYFAPGYREAGLDGSAHAFAYSSTSGQTATWTGQTPYTSPGGPGNLPAGIHNIDLILEVTVTGYGANPWIGALTIPGLDPLDPGVGAVVDITAGNDFTVVFEYLAVLPGIGTVAMNDVAQGPPGGQTQTSIGTHWFATVPEPGTALLVGLGLAAIGRRHRPGVD